MKPVKKPKLIRITLMNENGFYTNQVPVIQALDDGVFLTKSTDGKGYVATDAVTGYVVASGKTKAACQSQFESRREEWRRIKTQKHGPYHRFAPVNEKAKNGEWEPVKKPGFHTVRTVVSERRGKDGKYVTARRGIAPVSSKKATREFMRNRAGTRPGLPTIRKIYASGGEVVKVVDYEKGYVLTRRSTFMAGREPRGTKLVSKKFIK